MPRGGGTGLSGQTINHAIVMDFTREMGNVLEVNVEEQWVRAQPGVVLSELNRQLAPHGLLYGIDPSTQNRATIGGGVGNNSCGAHSIVYGKTIDNVHSLEAVLADGTKTTFEALDGAALQAKLDQPGLEGNIYRELRRIGVEQAEEIERRFPKIMRRVSGYNLDDFVHESGPMDVGRMVVGSEGTLAVVTEAKLQLAPAAAGQGPRRRALPHAGRGRRGDCRRPGTSRRLDRADRLRRDRALPGQHRLPQARRLRRGHAGRPPPDRDGRRNRGGGPEQDRRSQSRPRPQGPRLLHLHDDGRRPSSATSGACARRARA